MTEEQRLQLEALNDELRPLVYQGALQVYELMHRGLIDDYRDLTTIIRKVIEDYDIEQALDVKYPGTADDQTVWMTFICLMDEFQRAACDHPLFYGMDPWSDAAKEMFEWEAFPEQVASLICSVKGDSNA